MNHVLLRGLPSTPSKIVCIGQNYVAHIEELGNEIPDQMVVFIKPNSAVGDRVQASLDEPLHYEGELSFVVEGSQFTAVAFGLDLTRRGLQTRLRDKGLPWERAKCFDGAAVFSEFVPFEHLDGLSLSLTINGATVQSGGVDLMMYKPATILAELSRFLTLEDGDIVMTGTPAGVGPITAGDALEGQVHANGRTLVSAHWIAA